MRTKDKIIDCIIIKFVKQGNKQFFIVKSFDWENGIKFDRKLDAEVFVRELAKDIFNSFKDDVQCLRGGTK